MLCLNQFLCPILNWVFFAFYTLLLTLMFSKHSSVFKRLCEFTMRLFPRVLSPYHRLSHPQTLFDFHFAKNSMPQLIPGEATVNICQGAFPKVTDLKRSAKGTMKISFRNAPYAKPSTSKSTTEM